jgi:hypothetical protein
MKIAKCINDIKNIKIYNATILCSFAIFILIYPFIMTVLIFTRISHMPFMNVMYSGLVMWAVCVVMILSSEDEIVLNTEEDDLFS